MTPLAQQDLTMPQWLSNRGLIGYFIVLTIVSMMFVDHALHLGWMFIGTIEVFFFFYIGGYFSRRWRVSKLLSDKIFEVNLFRVGFLLRLITVICVYLGFFIYYEDAFGFESADASYYHAMGGYMADAIRDGVFISTWEEIFEGTDLSDMGFFTLLSIIYYIFGNDAIIIPRFVNCIVSAYTAVLIYKLGVRNFGQQVGRMAGVFVMLWPNFWFYCGTHLKEPIMIFVAVLFSEQVDFILRSRQLSISKILPALLLAGLMFSFRTPLALVMILSFLFSVFISSTRIVGWGKRIIIGSIALGMIGITMGNRISEQAESLIQQAQSNQQEYNMEWRARRDNGNAFAKYAGAIVFAPLIFTIPLPTMVETPMQYDLKIVNGGNYCKSVISGFVIFALLSLLLSGKWRNHVVLISMLIGYLMVLVMSTFAQSERFHQPVVPFEMIFASYGISLCMQRNYVFGRSLQNRKTSDYKQMFTYWLILIMVACIFWQWFKLAGRGMI